MSHRRRRSHNLRNALIAIIALVFIISVVVVAYQMNGGKPVSPSSGTKVLLVTSMGNITIELYDDMPITTGNFKNLTGRGIYDGTIFHRVISGSIVQGGDPTGTGYGDPNIPAIPDELPNKHNNVNGTVAMANKGPNTGSSQFFFNLRDNSAYYDTDYPVFGKVIAGMDIVDSIGAVATDSNDRPLQEVRLIKAEIVG